MCQCQEATINSYSPYDSNPYVYDPYASYEANPYPYQPYDANSYPYPPYEPNPPPAYAAVPYPVYPTVTYDPYWPSRVTPSHRPLLLVSRVKRFRGEVHSGNCLLIVE